MCDRGYGKIEDVLVDKKKEGDLSDKQYGENEI